MSQAKQSTLMQPMDTVHEDQVSTHPASFPTSPLGIDHDVNILLTATSTVESFDILSGASSSLRAPGVLEPPSFGLYQMLIGALLLTNFVAVGSAFDARRDCIDQEMYIWLINLGNDDQGNRDDDVFYSYQEYDDQYNDDFISVVREECMDMFRTVVLPVGVTTLVSGILAICVIRRHLNFLEATSDTYVTSHLSTLATLLVPLFIAFLAWTYGNFSIMLKPKVDPFGYNENPFKSLAAVDQMGHIGDNANLFYMSWMSQTLIMVLMYQVIVECFRRFRRSHCSPALQEMKSFSDNISMHEQIQNMLAYTSARRLAYMYRKQRKMWYQFMLHLRERSGYWVAAFFSSLVLFGSSSYVFQQVLVNFATSLYGNNDFRYRDVCTIVRGNSEFPEEFCSRTSFAVLIGAIASCLCVIAMVLHIFVRRRAASDEDQQQPCTVNATQVLLPGVMDLETTRFPLGLEFVLSLCLSVLLGANAVFATGVQGPAATVGNLYYASWFSFFLCLRICLGCLEEIYHVRLPSKDRRSIDSIETSAEKEVSTQSSSLSGSELILDMKTYERVGKKERQSRLRKYFFLSIFSTVCCASAWDAAYNQQSEWTQEQKYLIFSPAVVAILSVIMFLLCLKQKPYQVVSHICFGGLLSVVCFLLWLINLIITMHSEDSWAVNGIGEMKLANIYYYSWASILVAALQMVSYLKPLLGNKSKDAMILVWGGNVKVCMVILGAASHVWYGIRDTCESDDKEEVDITFCSRTKFAMAVGVTGVLSGWTVMGSRILGCSIAKETRNIGEAILSLLLVVLFGVAVTLITSMGGPGQSVGDLYYATWLSFWVSMAISISCFDQMKQDQLESRAKDFQATEGDGIYTAMTDNQESAREII